MVEQANRIDWLERQLAQVREFIARDSAVMQKEPEDFATELSLSSWRSQYEDLLQELRQEKAALQKEVVLLRLFGQRMDGSIPLRLLSKLAERFNAALAHAAYHLRYGTSPSRAIPEDLYEEIDLRLSGLATGSTRLYFAGNIAPDVTGETPLEEALEQIFEVLTTPSPDALRDLTGSIGVKAVRELSSLMEALEKQQIGAELTWPSPRSRVYTWGGSLQHVRTAHERLTAVTELKPEPTTIFGSISVLNESGGITIKSKENGKIKVSYSRQQYDFVKQFTLGQEVRLKVMKYTKIDNVSEREIASYRLVVDKDPNGDASK